MHAIKKNNRDPITTLDEDVVHQALSALQEKRLAGPASGADSRVTKYEHRLQEVFNFDRREIAVLCVLLLRGPQTPGELRTRTERMYKFEALEDIVSTLGRLNLREPPLARVLPRQPGTKESRYMHLFSGEPEVAAIPPPPSHAESSTIDASSAPIERLEHEVSNLRREVAELREEISVLRKELL